MTSARSSKAHLCLVCKQVVRLPEGSMNANGCTANSQGGEEDSSHTACNSSDHAEAQRQDMPLWSQDRIQAFKEQKLDIYAQTHKEQGSKHSYNRNCRNVRWSTIPCVCSPLEGQFLQLLQSQMQKPGLLLYLVRKKMITPDITAIPMNFSLSLRKSSWYQYIQPGALPIAVCAATCCSIATAASCKTLT